MLENPEMPIENYVLDYFVIGVIMSVLLCHCEGAQATEESP
jgi:hypothetical protein